MPSFRQWRPISVLKVRWCWLAFFWIINSIRLYFSISHDWMHLSTIFHSGTLCNHVHPPPLWKVSPSGLPSLLSFKTHINRKISFTNHPIHAWETAVHAAWADCCVIVNLIPQQRFSRPNGPYGAVCCAAPETSNISLDEPHTYALNRYLLQCLICCLALGPLLPSRAPVNLMCLTWGQYIPP